MEITVIRCHKRRTRPTYAQGHRVGRCVHLIAVRHMLHLHGDGIGRLHGRILIVHHIEPEDNRHNECRDLGE